MSEDNKTIPEQFEEIKTEICGIYCKYPEVYHALYLQDFYLSKDAANQAMITGVCNRCPLTRL